MSETLRPYFWIRRNADTYVPLVAVDELPESFSLRGISTIKNLQDICQGEMRFLGDHPKDHGQHYVVELLGTTADVATSPSKIFRAPDKQDIGPNHSSSDGNAGGQTVDQIQANIDQITSCQEESAGGSQDGSQDYSDSAGNEGTLGKKVYCTYWIRTGNCNYMQEGCKYKHEIPPDDETRLAIGVRTYPTWPREDPTPPPRPVKAWQGKKPAIQHSWRRQDTARGPSSDLSGAQKGADGPKGGPRTPASSANRVQSGIPASGQTTVPSQPTRNGPNIAQISSGTIHATPHQPHGQASAPGPVNNKNSSSAAPQTVAASFNRQAAHLAPQFPSNQSDIMGVDGHRSPPNHPPVNHSVPTMQSTKGQNNDHVNGLGLGTKASANTSDTITDNVRSANPPPFMPFNKAVGQSMDIRTQYPATLSYDNHPFSISSDLLANASTSTHGNHLNGSVSRMNTPTTTDSRAAPALDNLASINRNVPGWTFRAGTPLTTNISPYGKLNGNAPSFSFGSNDSVRAQTPASVNGSVASKFNGRLQNPFSPPPFSPQPLHRRMFRGPGEAEYVANSIEDSSPKPQRTIKKSANGSVHGKGKPHGGKGPHAGKGVGHGQKRASPQAQGLRA